MDLELIRNKLREGQYYLSEHAHRERQKEQVTVEEIEQTILKGDIIEKYPNDLRGESCLAAGKVGGKPLHVVCGLQAGKLLIVTVYRPKLPIWQNYKTRAKELKSRV